ncbi:MAG: hypothetical protein ACRECP_09775 [Methylocella sp.]
MGFAQEVWQHPRRNYKARIFDAYTSIVDTCRAVPNALTAETGRIAFIGSRGQLSQKPS